MLIGCNVRGCNIFSAFIDVRITSSCNNNAFVKLKNYELTVIHEADFIARHGNKALRAIYVAVLLDLVD